MKTLRRPGRPKAARTLSMYSFRISADQLAALRRAANRRKSTPSALLRAAIEKMARGA